MAETWPPEVRAHERMAHYHRSTDGDLRGWRWAKDQELKRILERNGPPSLALKDYENELREAIEEIDQVLRLRGNKDWPFR